MPIELEKDERRVLTQKARTAVLEAVRALGGEGNRKDILDRALQAGRFTAQEMAVTVTDSAGKRQHSYVESRLAWELANLKREGLLDNPERGRWRLTEAGAKRPEPLVRARVTLDRLRELREMSHGDYLDTPEWERTRTAALQRAGHRCSRDRRHKNEIDVHHAIRVRVGAELPSDLVVLCRSCYEQHPPRNGNGQPKLDAAEVVEAVSVAPPMLAAVVPAPAPAPAEEADGDRSLLRRFFSRA